MANTPLDRPRQRSGFGVARAGAAVLSPWTISGLCALALALLVDQGVGARPTRALVAPAGAPLHRALVYASRLGMLPVVIAAGILVAGWLAHHRRRHAAAAVAGSVLLALCFGARSFAAVDFIGWRAALVHMVTDGRVATTTAVAVVTSFVLWHERMIGRRVATCLGVGLPLMIGLMRVYLGAHSASAIAVQWLIGAIMAYAVIRAYDYAMRITSMGNAAEAATAPR